MSLNLHTVLALLAFVLTVAHGITGKVPLWVPVLLVCLLLLVP